jgi:hypothetical protein
LSKSSVELALNVLLSVFFNLVGSLVLLGQGDDFLHCKYPDLSTQVRAPTLSTWECRLLPLVLVSLELCHKVSAMGGTSNWAVVLCSGVVIAESILRSQDKIQGRDWGYLAILYVFVQLSRVVVVGLLYPGLKYFGYGLNWKEALVLVWAGLRGAVALSLSLSVAVSTHANSQGILLSILQLSFRC